MMRMMGTCADDTMMGTCTDDTMMPGDERGYVKNNRMLMFVCLFVFILIRKFKRA